jgi:ABC-type uncharacterized transport system auxiliary subunit
MNLIHERLVDFLGVRVNVGPVRRSLGECGFFCSLAALSLILLSGCISSDAQLIAVNQKHSYALQANLPAKPMATPRFENLKMLSFNSQPPFDGGNLIVKRANGETVSDYYSTWIASPHELIRVQAMDYLRKSGLFKAVYDSSSGALAPMGLEGTVEEILLDFRKERPMAIITLRLSIVDETATDFTLLWSDEATGSAPLESSNPADLVAAFEKALTQSLAKLTRELEKSSLQPKGK